MIQSVTIQGNNNDENKKDKMIQNMKAMSSIMHVCIRLLCSEYSNDQLFKDLIKQFCFAIEALNLSETIRHLLLVNDLHLEGGQVYLKNVKLEIVQILTRLISLPPSSTPSYINEVRQSQAVKIMHSIFQFNEVNGNLKILSKLIKKEDISNSSSEYQFLQNITYMIAIWSKYDKTFRDALYACQIQEDWASILEMFNRSDNTQLQDCAEKCKKWICLS